MWFIVSETYRSVFRNPAAVFRIAGGWFAFQVFVLLAAVIIIGPERITSLSSSGQVLLNGVVQIVQLIASASIAVAWHRFILLEEAPEGVNFTISIREGKFILKAFQIILVAFVVSTIMLIPLAFIVYFIVYFSHSKAVAIILYTAAYLFVIPFSFRFLLLLPATAVDMKLGLGEAWRLGKGFGWRIFGSSIICLLPALIAIALLTFLGTLATDYAGVPNLIVFGQVGILSAVIWIFAQIIGIAVLTSAFELFLERNSAPLQGY